MGRIQDFYGKPSKVEKPIVDTVYLPNYSRRIVCLVHLSSSKSSSHVLIRNEPTHYTKHKANSTYKAAQNVVG